MEQSSKAIVRNVFEFKDLPRVPFIPWVCSFAARLEQIEIEEMLSDAGAMSKSLINAQKLFGYDAIVNIFDSSLEAEACGCQISWSEGTDDRRIVSHPLNEGANIEDLDLGNFFKRGRIPAVLEATKRIKAVKGKDVAIIGVVTGPITLASHLSGDSVCSQLDQGSDEAVKLIAEAGAVTLKLCRIYCELGVDVVAVAEAMLGQISPARYQLLAAPFRTIWNVARYYNIHPLLLSKDCRQEHVEPILGMGADGVGLAGGIDYTLLSEAARQLNICYGRPVPNAVFTDPDATGGDSVISPLSTQKGCFLSTEWELPATADINIMHRVADKLRGNQVA